MRPLEPAIDLLDHLLQYGIGDQYTVIIDDHRPPDTADFETAEEGTQLLQSNVDGVYGGKLSAFVVNRQRRRDTKTLIGEKHINIAPEELSRRNGALVPRARARIIVVGGIPIGSDHFSARIPTNPACLGAFAPPVHVLCMNRRIGHLLQHEKIALGIGETEGGELGVALEDVHRERLGQTPALALQCPVSQHFLCQADHHRRRLEKTHHLADDAPFQLLQQIVGEDAGIRPVGFLQIGADPRDSGEENQQGDYGDRYPEEAPQAPAALGPQIEGKVERVCGRAHQILPSGCGIGTFHYGGRLEFYKSPPPSSPITATRHPYA